MSTAFPLDAPHPGQREELRARLEQAVDGCSDDDLLWASGFVAGLAARARQREGDQRTTPSASLAAHSATTLTILYGSQTGNGKAIAERALAEARGQGVAVRAMSLADFNYRQLKQERALLLIVSTHGDGDPPDDAMALHRYLHGTQAPRLEQLSFSVVALGDSSYPHFCKTGRDFDERLAALGAQRLTPRVDCDLDFAASSPPAVTLALSALARKLGEATGSARIALVDTTARPAIEAAAPQATATATVLLNQRLTGRYSSKDVRHLELALATDDFPYEPGDSVAVSASNPPAVIGELLALMDWQAETAVSVDGTTMPLGQALANKLELTLLSRPVLAAIGSRSDDPGLHDALTNANGSTLVGYMAERQLVDVLRESRAQLNPQEFVDLARPLATRSYSIASSRAATPDELHLTVAVIAGSRDGRPRPGCASSFLADSVVDAPVRLTLEVNHAFRLPRQDDVPVIMIGPGTGVAPFRAFVEERAARGATGRNWLFFGERTQREDFLYQLEWLRHLRQGALQRLDVAFSRDGASKHYVQDRLRANAREVYAWLQDGAHIYVCGDAQRMAKDVEQALLALIAEASGRGGEAADEYLFELRQRGRYQRDVY